MKKIFLSILSLAMVLGMTLNAKADLIDWSQGSTNLFQGDDQDETFVSLNGTSAAAYNATNLLGGGGVGADVTVNGVTFTAAEVGTTVTGAAGESITLNGGGNNEGAFGSGQFANANVAGLIQGGSLTLQTVQLAGLTVGDTYEIQTFVHDGRGSRQNAVTGYSQDGGGVLDVASIGQLNNQNTGEATSGNTGDFIIGTFTADALLSPLKSSAMETRPMVLHSPLAIVNLLSMQFSCVTLQLLCLSRVHWQLSV